MKCPLCEGTGWQQFPEGVRKCQCRKPQQAAATLSKPDLAALTIAATKASEEFGAWADYPKGLEPAARRAVAAQLVQMCSTPQQVEYITRRAIGLFRCWKECGVPGLRQILVSKFRARDGIESGPLAISEAYPEGLPGEKDGLTGYQLHEGLDPAVITDKKLLPGIQNAAQQKRIATPQYALPPDKREPRPVPIPIMKPVTPADIEAEMKRRKNGNGSGGN